MTVNCMLGSLEGFKPKDLDQTNRNRSSTLDPHGEQCYEAARLEPCGPGSGLVLRDALLRNAPQDEDFILSFLKNFKFLRRRYRLVVRRNKFDPHGEERCPCRR